MNYLGFEDRIRVSQVFDCVCRLVLHFISIHPSSQIDSRNLRSVNPAEVEVMNGSLENLDRVLKLQSAAGTVLIVRRSHNIHCVIFVVVRRTEVATDHRRVDFCLVNQL